MTELRVLFIDKLFDTALTTETWTVNVLEVTAAAILVKQLVFPDHSPQRAVMGAHTKRINRVGLSLFLPCRAVAQLGRASESASGAW